MLCPIRTALWEPNEWASHPLVNKLNQYMETELGFHDVPVPVRETTGLELLTVLGKFIENTILCKR